MHADLAVRLRYYWDQEANNFNFSVGLYSPKSVYISSKLCHFFSSLLFSSSFVKALDSWTPQATLPTLKIDHLLPHIVSYLLTNYLFV